MKNLTLATTAALVAFALAPPFAGQAGAASKPRKPGPVPQKPAPDPALRKSIGRELDRICDPRADWLLRKKAADQLTSLARIRDKADAVGSLVIQRYLQKTTPEDAVPLLLLVLGHMPAASRAAICEREIAARIDAENRLRKSNRRRVTDAALFQRLDILVCYCSKDGSYAAMIRINRELFHSSMLVLFGGVAGLLRDFTPHPRDRAAARKISTLLSGSKAEIKEKIRVYILRGKKKKISPGVARRIEEAVAGFDQPPDLVQEFDLALQHADLSTSCPILSCWDHVCEAHAVPRIDGDADDLRRLITGGRVDKHSSHLRALVMLLVSTRRDAAGFLPELGKALARKGHPPIYRHRVLDAAMERQSRKVTDHLVHLAAARAIVLALSSARAQVRSRHQATHRSALRYLATHGSRSEQELATTAPGRAR